MSKLIINAIATQALLDRKFHADILNGHRKERLSKFNLGNDDLDALLAIEASNLDQFISKLKDLLTTKEPLPLSSGYAYAWNTRHTPIH